MSDTSLSNDNAFADILNAPDAPPTDANAEAAPQAAPERENLFSDILNPPEEQTSATGAAIRVGGASVLPAASGLAAAGAGAEVGAAAGMIAGPIGAAVGGFAGGVLGFVGGNIAGSTVQDAALKALPESWVEALGQDDRQKQLDEEYHPTASFLGGIAPYILTMRPGGFGAAALPENATAWQKIVRNPVTSRLFGGLTMGGMELGQEALQGQKPNWANVGIATGFGLVFNKPTRIGEALAGIGSRTGTPEAAPTVAAAAPTADPTVAQAGDLKVMGPGVTESVFMGSHEQAPAVEQAAQDAARTENSILGPAPEPPDVGSVARRMEPETFQSYDALSEQRDALRAHLQTLANPAEEEFAAATASRDALQAQLDEHIAGRGGYAAGPVARALRAQIRDAQNQIDDLTARREAFAAGNITETPEMAQVRQQLMTTDFAMRDLAPQVSAAYRRAADAIGSGVVEPEAPAAPAPAAPADVSRETPAPGAPLPPETQAQVAAIAQSVARELVAAGRPADEAEAGGLLTAEHYRTRAARMDNAIGGPLALYESEGPTIRAGGARTARPAAVTPAVDYASAKAAADTQGVTNLVTRMIGAGASDAEISTIIGKKLSVDQVAAFRERLAPPPEVAAIPEREMAQGKTLEQAKRGSITFKENQRPLIKLFKDADASSFLHETGHQWLEELLRDAVHPAANDSVRADAQTVKDWLGVEGDTVATKQHEKFARGFEQYMREGIAPSQGLARVFAQFKSWLTAIYQTIKGLGSPINDDIRGVFDRLISEEPQRTVIAAEKSAQPNLADIHETEAALAHPAEAHAIGDRITAERDRYVAEQPPEIQNELARAEAARAVAGAESGGEGLAGAGGPPEVAGGGGEPGALLPGGISSSERGPVVAGGAPGVAEGTGVPGGESAAGRGPAAASGGLRTQRPEPSGSARDNPIAPSPGTLFGPAESPFTDKAGNIRLDTLTASADVAQAIRDSAKENNDFVGDRRGVITDGQVVDLADALGMDAAQLSTRNLGQAFNAEQVVAARKLLIQSATDVSDLMKRAAEGTDADVMAYAEGKARHQMIQAQVSGITAEAGRALRAFRSLVGQEQAQSVDQFLKNATAKTLFQLKAEAKLGARLDTPSEVSKFTRDALKPDFWDNLLEYWTNALISNPVTHATYAAGNELLAMMRAVPETATAAAIGAIRRARGRTGEIVHLSEVAAQLRAHGASLPASAKAAADALRLGTTTLLPGESPKTLPFQPKGQFAPHGVTDFNYRYSDVLPSLYGATRGILDGSIASGYLSRVAKGEEGAPFLGFKTSPTGMIPNIALRGVTVLPTGGAARLPGRFVGAIHSFFRATNASMEIARLSVRAAAEEGLQGHAFDARVAELRQNPTPAMWETASGGATEATLMGQGSAFVQKLSQLTNTRIVGLPILKLIDPFVKIGGNIIDQAIVERTPVGLLSSEIRADLAGKNGNIAQDTAMARMLVGTAMSIGFGALAARGVVSGSGPSDPRQAAIWRLAGNQAHSIRIGGMWYGMNRLGPIGMLASVAADMYDVAHAASDGDMQLVGASLMHALTQNILDESFMRGPSDLIRAVDDPGRYGQSYIRNFVASFIPYSSAMAQLARSSDPYSRQARTIMDAIKAKIPGMSESLMPYRNIWGEPSPAYSGLGNVTAIYETPVNHDPVNQAMLDGGYFPAYPERKIRNVELTDQQYDDYSRIAGRTAKQRLDVIVNSPDWRTWSQDTRHDVIQETIAQSRETARGYMMMKYPEIARQATIQKRAQIGQ